MFKDTQVKLLDIPPKNVGKSLTGFKAYYVDRSESSGVYSVLCQCDKEYVGVPKRNIPTRIKEHARDARNDNPNISGLSAHLKEEKHEIKSFKAVDNTTSNIERNIKETFQIIKRQPELNLDSGNAPLIWANCMKSFCKENITE